MENFTLTSTYVIDGDLKVNVCLKPTNNLISDYISTYRVYDNEQEALNNMNTFIEEMTPLLFSQFEEMVNVPIEIRNMFVYNPI
jgi:hypothetical protein